MELIDKTAVIAEIEKRIKKLKNLHFDTVTGYAGEISGLERLLSFLDTLEMKEVDLDLEITLWAHELYEIPYDDVERMAKYFFALGLKAKRAEGICKISETECQNFDEAQGTNFVRK